MRQLFGLSLIALLSGLLGGLASQSLWTAYFHHDPVPPIYVVDQALIYDNAKRSLTYQALEGHLSINAILDTMDPLFLQATEAIQAQHNIPVVMIKQAVASGPTEDLTQEIEEHFLTLLKGSVKQHYQPYPSKQPTPPSGRERLQIKK